MKKILVTLALLFVPVICSAQWQPHDPSGLIRDTAEMHILIDQFWFDIPGYYIADIILYDSIDHFVEGWTHLSLRDKDYKYTYNRIWKHIVYQKGSVKINGIDIPTKRKEDESYEQYSAF